ncbi:MAG: phosphate acyltransferase, partial [Pseudomonadota bacterium]
MSSDWGSQMSEVPAVLQALRVRATSDPKRIVLSEGDDPRVIAAAISARDVGMAQISVVGDAAKVQALLDDAGDDGTGITIHDPATSPLTPELETKLVELRGHKGMTPEKAAVQVQNRLVFAALLVRTGHADGTVGGAVETT